LVRAKANSTWGKIGKVFKQAKYAKGEVDIKVGAVNRGGEARLEEGKKKRLGGRGVPELPSARKKKKTCKLGKKIKNKK